MGSNILSKISLTGAGFREAKEIQNDIDNVLQ